ncbi:MAG: hypothetical protein GEV08_20150 [Acidimicrobiia bacterium]|nr:hypothetical protein [Acidimicrobiia bacterium]
MARKAADRLLEGRAGARQVTRQAPVPDHGAPGPQERRVSAGKGARRAESRRSGESTPVHVDREEVERAVGRDRSPRLERRLRQAAKSYGADRVDEALPLLRSVAGDAPDLAAARELYGLALYRVGRWGEAARELEAFNALSGSAEQHPVLADCYRALRRWDEVERLWDELRSTSPSAELVTEGRIVASGALADRGRLPDAIRLLEQGFRLPDRPREFHLRRMYALADLYERSGDLPRARDLFRRVSAAEPDFFDVTTRVRGLG